MSLSSKGKNTGADAIRTTYGYISLHSAAPNDSGSNETTAARIAAAWTTAASGEIHLAAALNFTGGASNGAVTHFGAWSAPTGGDFGGSYAVTGDASFNTAGEYTLDTASITNNG